MFRLFDFFLFALERLWQHRVLALWALLGLAVAATLALSLPLYVDAVNSGLLSSRLADPPYAFRLRYLGSWEGNITRQDVTAADAAIRVGFTTTIDLPVASEITYVRAGTWTLRTGTLSLGAFGIGALTGQESQITIVDGQWPPEAPTVAGQPVPVLIPERMLYTMGLQVGDELEALQPGGDPYTLRVAALWRAADAEDTGWIFPPRYFDQVLLVQTDDLWTLAAGIERPVEEAGWWLIFDGSTVKTSEVDGLLARMVTGRRDAVNALPGIRVDVSPENGLKTFSEEVKELTQQLLIIILPVGGLVLYFVTLVAGLLVSRQQQEDVTLRSRGMSRQGLLGIHLLMWLILAGTALGVGIAAAPAVVQLVGRTTSFLRFEGVGDPLDVIFTSQALLAGLLTSLAAASSGLYIAWRTTGQTITSFKQQSARATKAWWQRIYLDVLAPIPALYVLYTLTQKGGLIASADDPFADPLIFIGPTLFLLGLTLLLLRLWPVLLGLAARLVAFGPGIPLLMSLRELTRSIHRYRGSLLMMCFTLSLIGFTASMASTIDRSLADAIDYQIGADGVIITASDAQTEESEDDSGTTTLTVVGYNAPPVVDLLTVDGVANISPVGRFPGRIVLPSQRVEGTVLGMDRATMAAVTRFRQDYAEEPLADLFNRLAGNRTGVLLSRTTAEAYNLIIGQEIRVEFAALDTWYEMTVPILGLLDFFPTLDPRDGFFLVMNLDPLLEAAGTSLPHNVWLSLAPDADVTTVRNDISALGFPILEWRNPATALLEAQAQPSRRGVLGFLSVGFVAAVVLTLVGAIIQSAASFRAQATQLGSLRAMGLGGFAVGRYLILVQGISASSGILGGTSIGMLTTLLFLPLLDFSGGLPPYLVRVAWQEIVLVYGLFASALLAVTLLTTLLLGRENITALVKLGDV